jgi:phosphate transport system protein
MPLYEKRLQEDLSHIRDQIGTMGEMTEQALANAVHALLTGNRALANNTVLADHPINRKMREIDRLCHGFIARHLPSAGHLRMISSIIRINIELERIGDYAVTISRESLQFKSPPSGVMAQEMESIADEAKRILHQALTAFYEGSADMAKAASQLPAHLQTTLGGIYTALMNGEFTSDIKEMFAVFAALTQMKRVADQAKNICEETIFAITGETKAVKAYNILFVDRENSRLSQMAEAIARKSYPNSGRYSSAGQQPAAQVDQELVEFLDQRGLDLSRAQPKPLNFTNQELSEFHVIVSLDGPIESYFGTLPFHTTGLEWTLGTPLSDLSGNQATGRYEEVYRELSYHIRHLMELLRGEGAD